MCEWMHCCLWKTVFFLCTGNFSVTVELSGSCSVTVQMICIVYASELIIIIIIIIINSNYNTLDHICNAVMYVVKACESSLGSLNVSQLLPGGCQLVGQVASLTFESACRLLSTERSPIAMYYCSTMRLILIYCPSEGRRLSRPRHCSQCASCAHCCMSQ